MIRTTTHFTFDFDSLQKTLKHLRINPEIAAELMGMTSRNFYNLRADAQKIKIRNLLALTNQVGLDIRDFFIESEQEAPSPDIQ